jgi:DNA uptake protein ComE-like DNA-binding protein
VGFVLVSILILIMLASMVAISLLFRLKAEDTASSATAGSEQAWAAAMSGIHEAMRIAAQAAPGSTAWQDNPRAFRDRFVFEDGRDRWYFSVYSAADPDAREEVRFGLTGEASKLNLNRALEARLAKLPKMTAGLAQTLADFLDADDTARPEGAEQEYYDSLPRPYGVRNRSLSTLEELLLVRGFTPALLYGEDANMNFRLDPNENDGDERFPPDNKDERLDLGLRQYLTVAAYELNQDNDGVPRTDLNDPTDPLPGVELPAALTNYIAALRQNKIQLSHAADLLEAKLKVKDNRGKEVELSSGVGKAELPTVLDLFTATAEQRLEGLIDVNTAAAPVLQTVPDIDDALADSIISARRSLGPEQRSTIAWLYQEGVVDATLFKKLAPFLTARSLQFSFRVTGYSIPSGRYRVFDVMIDLAGGSPRTIYLRDLTRLGLPFRIQTEEVETPGAQASRPLCRSSMAAIANMRSAATGRTIHSPSPQPSPCGRGSVVRRIGNAGITFGFSRLPGANGKNTKTTGGACHFPGTVESDSLSPRERVRVRGKELFKVLSAFVLAAWSISQEKAFHG